VKILAIDPGTDQSALVEFLPESKEPIGYREIVANNQIPGLLSGDRWNEHELVVEMIASYGMPVGRDVFFTCLWIGRFMDRFEILHRPASLMFRRTVKQHLCGNVAAKDVNIRQALIDALGAPGTKASPGLTHGIKKDLWAALGVGVARSLEAGRTRLGGDGILRRAPAVDGGEWVPWVGE
jgi:hypothetical protein